jgi:hypothetical protein
LDEWRIVAKVKNCWGRAASMAILMAQRWEGRGNWAEHKKERCAAGKVGTNGIGIVGTRDGENE